MIHCPRTVVVLCAAPLLLAGCQVRTVVVSSPFATELTVDPLEVQAGSGFEVTLAVHNLADRDLQLGSPNTCFASLAFDLNGIKVPLAGSGASCVGAPTSFEFGAGSVRLFHWSVRAELDANAGGVDGRAVPTPGDYRVTANLHVELPSVSDEFVITAPVIEPRLPLF